VVGTSLKCWPPIGGAIANARASITASWPRVAGRSGQNRRSRPGLGGSSALGPRGLSPDARLGLRSDDRGSPDGGSAPSALQPVVSPWRHIASIAPSCASPGETSANVLATGGVVS